MKRTMMLLLAAMLCSGAAASERTDSLLVMFWNVENFFDWHSDARPGYWTARRFYAKCNAIAKTVLKVAERCGRLPDAIGLAEVENSYVLRSLVNSTVLRKLDYRIVHFESPDHRGIDCALLCRRSSLPLRGSSPKHLLDSAGNILPTRDILLAEFDSLAILVNHHPSKLGGKSDTRDAAMRKMLATADSLVSAGRGRVLAIGDFNESLWSPDSPGTIKYNGRWEKIDGCFAWGFRSHRELVFDDPSLLEPDRAFGGMKPRRTFVGPRYAGGVSDHLPVAVYLYF